MTFGWVTPDLMVFEQTCSKRKASRGWGGVEKGRACAQGRSGLPVQSWSKLRRVVGVKLESSGEA